MPVSPRSAVLGRWRSVASQTHVMFTVPAGMTAIVKTVVINNRSATTATVVVSMQGPNATLNVDIVRGPAAVGAEPVTWNGWMVLDAGGEVTAASDQSTCDFWVSGTILQGVPNIPPAPSTQPDLPTIPIEIPQTPAH